MHRSGTSFLASYLQACGLHIGDDLLDPFKDNIKGYFEDKDFVNFHKKVIEKNKKNMFLLKKIVFDSDDLIHAKEIVEKKTNLTLWGWKDPRTTLFLDFWNVLLEDALYIFVYRNPYQVVNSLIRRNTDKAIKLNPFVSAKSWILYNQNLLKFRNLYHDRVLLFNIHDIIGSNNFKFIDLIINKFNIKLLHKPFSCVFDKNIFSHHIGQNFKLNVVSFIYRYKLYNLYKELEKYKTIIH